MSEKDPESEERSGWTTLALWVVVVAEAAGVIALIVWKLTQ
jgi:hypothetical protein